MKDAVPRRFIDNSKIHAQDTCQRYMPKIHAVESWPGNTGDMQGVTIAAHFVDDNEKAAPPPMIFLQPEHIFLS